MPRRNAAARALALFRRLGEQQDQDDDANPYERELSDDEPEEIDEIEQQAIISGNLFDLVYFRPKLFSAKFL